MIPVIDTRKANQKSAREPHCTNIPDIFSLGQIDVIDRLLMYISSSLTKLRTTEYYAALFEKMARLWSRKINITIGSKKPMGFYEDQHKWQNKIFSKYYLVQFIKLIIAKAIA